MIRPETARFGLGQVESWLQPESAASCASEPLQRLREFGV